MERNLPTFGVASLRKWLDKRCEKKIAKWEPVPAPTLPLPWEHFKRMPKRLKGGRHRDVHLSEDMEVPDVHRGEPCRFPASAPIQTLPPSVIATGQSVASKLLRKEGLDAKE